MAAPPEPARGESARLSKRPEPGPRGPRAGIRIGIGIGIEDFRLPSPRGRVAQRCFLGAARLFALGGAALALALFFLVCCFCVFFGLGGRPAAKSRARPIQCCSAGSSSRIEGGITAYSRMGRPPMGSNGSAPGRASKRARSGPESRTNMLVPNKPQQRFPPTNAQADPNILRRVASLSARAASNSSTSQGGFRMSSTAASRVFADGERTTARRRGGLSRGVATAVTRHRGDRPGARPLLRFAVRRAAGWLRFGEMTQSFRYVALGDSTGLGVGAERDGGYVDRLAQRLSRSVEGLSVENLCRNGATAGGVPPTTGPPAPRLPPPLLPP